ncbi:hypothetical protein KC19_5G199800 [Ceratodon purpureus]|uniref:Uncharacterized protein n=1 Tax=Ceratodon purpureus TaxID=3225 RepID=A0A8T0I4I9_CERPU|nr:hypothetical protein KC19_5G199800 [Ceratodon purpureus]
MLRKSSVSRTLRSHRACAIRGARLEGEVGFLHEAVLSDDGVNLCLRLFPEIRVCHELWLPHSTVNNYAAGAAVTAAFSYVMRMVT